MSWADAAKAVKELKIGEKAMDFAEKNPDLMQTAFQTAGSMIPNGNGRNDDRERLEDAYNRSALEENYNRSPDAEPEKNMLQNVGSLVRGAADIVQTLATMEEFLPIVGEAGVLVQAGAVAVGTLGAAVAGEDAVGYAKRGITSTAIGAVPGGREVDFAVGMTGESLTDRIGGTEQKPEDYKTTPLLNQNHFDYIASSATEEKQENYQTTPLLNRQQLDYIAASVAANIEKQSAMDGMTMPPVHHARELETHMQPANNIVRFKMEDVRGHGDLHPTAGGHKTHTHGHNGHE